MRALPDVGGRLSQTASQRHACSATGLIMIDGVPASRVPHACLRSADTGVGAQVRCEAGA